MRRKTCAWLAGTLSMILLGGACLAQDRQLDSLQALLTHPLPDTARISVLLTLGDHFSYVDGDRATAYLDQAFRLARRHQLHYAMGSAMAYAGTVYYYRDEYDSAMYCYRQAMACFRQDSSLDARLSLSTVESEMADVEVARGDLIGGIQTYLRVTDTLQRYDPNNHNAIGNLYLAVASVYRKMRQYEQALRYARKSVLELGKDQTKPRAKAFAALAVAANLSALGRLKEAADSLDLIEETAKTLKSSSLLAQLYGTRASLYDRRGQPDRALAAYGQALHYARKAGDKHGQVSALLQMGLIAADSSLRDYAGSQAYLEKALALIRLTGDKHRERTTTGHLAKVLSLRGRDREAVHYYQQYFALTDSLNEADVKKKINEIENKYQARKKGDSILVLQKNARVRDLELHKKKMLNTALLSGCLVLLLVGVLIYHNFKRKNQLLRQREELNRKRIIELEKERQLLAMQSVLKGQEQERGRLARDLHDGVGGLLSGIKLSLTSMKGNVFLSEENALAVNQVILQLDQSINELRRVSHNMMPEALIKYGLREALENYADNINRSGGLLVRLQAYGMEQRMGQDTEIVLYRIVQELLNNVIKHAGAKNVLIQLLRENDRFSLTVEDDGKGFYPAEAGRQGGAGLANIQARADYIGARVDIRSAPGEGTSVNIEGQVMSG